MENYIIALDLGTESTSIIGAMVDEYEPYGIRVIHQETVTSQGMRRGIVDNTEKVKAIVNNLVLGAERKLKKPNNIRKWYICSIGGRNYRCETVRYDRNTAGQSISDITVNQLCMEAHNRVMVSMDEELTRFAPTYYSLDSQPFVKNPVGFSANKMEGYFMATITSRDAIANLNSILPRTSKASFEQVYPSASAKAAILLPEEDRNGTVLVDLGAGTTNVAVTYKGSVCYDVSIPFGSDTITRDIAAGMSLSMEKAEMLKRAFGLHAPVKDSKVVNVNMGDETYSCNINKLEFIIRARVEEIVKYVDSVIVKTRSIAKVSNIVLAGGGSQLKGIEEVFAEGLALPTRVASMPKTKIDATESLSAVLGMASLFAREYKPKFDKEKESDLFSQPEVPEVLQPQQPQQPQQPAEQPAKEKKWYSPFTDFASKIMDDGPAFGEEKK